MLAMSVILAFAIIGISFYLTIGNKGKRIMIGLMLILSLLSYPLILPLLQELQVIQGLEGTATLMVFYFILLIGGIITTITGLFTRTTEKRDLKS